MLFDNNHLQHIFCRDIDKKIKQFFLKVFHEKGIVECSRYFHSFIQNTIKFTGTRCSNSVQTIVCTDNAPINSKYTEFRSSNLLK